MRVLYLCHRIPYPPNKGDKIRAFHQLQAIAKRHEVDLFTLVDDPGDLEYRAELSKLCNRLTVSRVYPGWARMRTLPYLLTPQPLTIPYFYSSELASEVRHALGRRSYDRIFVYCSAMAQYVDAVDRIPMLMDFVDVDSEKWTQYASFTKFPLSAIYRREGRALRAYERKICEKAAAVLVTTEREAQLVRQISAGAPVHVIPNGVDTSYFDPSAVSPAALGPAIIFTGDMSYFPNEQAVTNFANSVLPLIRQAVPDVRFMIVGRNPGPGVLELRRIDGVEVTGFVPDVRTYLARAQVAVAPFSIAAGIQNKILEALAYGLPVVATSKAAQALSRGVAEQLYTGDTPEDMAAKITALLRDPQLAYRKGSDGRRQVAKDYRWDSSLDQMMKLLENPVSSEFLKAQTQASLCVTPSPLLKRQ